MAVFFISRSAPGEPLLSYYGERVEKMTVEEKDAARERLGLNEPVTVQYVKWLAAALSGDFGISYKYKQDCMEVIGQRAGNTIILVGIGLVFLFAGSLAIGAVCAAFEGRWPDKVISKVGTVISCIPEFWFSIILILIFAVYLRILPSGGAYDIGHEQDVGNRLIHLILPLFMLVITHLWYYGYMIRNKLVEETRYDYVLLAKAKGLGKASVIIKHCIKNVMPSYVSIMAISVPHLLGDAYIIESVFAYPGLGALSYESARYADYNLLMLICMITGIVVIFFNMAGHVINEKIDPRIKEQRTVEKEEVKINED